MTTTCQGGDPSERPETCSTCYGPLPPTTSNFGREYCGRKCKDTRNRLQALSREIIGAPPTSRPRRDVVEPMRWPNPAARLAFLAELVDLANELWDPDVPEGWAHVSARGTGGRWTVEPQP